MTDSEPPQKEAGTPNPKRAEELRRMIQGDIEEQRSLVENLSGKLNLAAPSVGTQVGRTRRRPRSAP